jgi:hypothetical protein
MGLLKLNLADDVEIGGSVLVVDLNAGEYREFNSYTLRKEAASIMGRLFLIFSACIQ